MLYLRAKQEQSVEQGHWNTVLLVDSNHWLDCFDMVLFGFLFLFFFATESPLTLSSCYVSTSLFFSVFLSTALMYGSTA